MQIVGLITPATEVLEILFARFGDGLTDRFSFQCLDCCWRRVEEHSLSLFGIELQTDPARFFFDCLH